jgi:hypothetical protein
VTEQEIRNRCKMLHAAVIEERKELDALVDELTAIVRRSLDEGMSLLVRIDAADGFMNIYVSPEAQP